MYWVMEHEYLAKGLTETALTTPCIVLTKNFLQYLATFIEIPCLYNENILVRLLSPFPCILIMTCLYLCFAHHGHATVQGMVVMCSKDSHLETSYNYIETPCPYSENIQNLETFSLSPLSLHAHLCLFTIMNMPQFGFLEVTINRLLNTNF